MTLESQELIRQYKENKNQVLKEKIVSAYRTLVEYIAKKLAFNYLDLDDLIQVGNIGLLRSIERYDLTKNVDFSTFATPNIIGEIKHYFRDKSNILKLPRKLQEQNNQIRAFIQEYTQDTGRSPTVKLIAQELGLSEETIIESLEATQFTKVISLDAPMYEKEARAQKQTSLLENLGIEAIDEQVLNKEFLKQALKQLSNREQKVIYLRYYQSLTQAEMAQELNISQTHISRLIEQILEKLRKILNYSSKEMISG